MGVIEDLQVGGRVCGALGILTSHESVGVSGGHGGGEGYVCLCCVLIVSGGVITDSLVLTLLFVQHSKAAKNQEGEVFGSSLAGVVIHTEYVVYSARPGVRGGSQNFSLLRLRVTRYRAGVSANIVIIVAHYLDCLT
jgi:hypothetical protein